MEFLIAITLALLAGHGLCLFCWTRHLVQLVLGKRPTNGKEFHPRAAVFLSVRGADPYLAECLHGVLNQDYPAYDVYIIVDSHADGAWDVITCIRSARAGVRVHIDTLKEPLPTCSLKMSALLQAIAQLDEACEIIALIDADVVPHPSWLRDLAAPLSDREVGATTGIRWFAPFAARGRPPWGTLVRYLWNAAAVVHMVPLHIPWGGSLAIRADVLRRSKLLEEWSRSLFEDTAFYEALRLQGLKIHFVSEALMVNRENISMRGCFQYIQRQLVNVRLYHPHWWIVLGLGVLSTVSITMAAALALLEATQGNALLAATLAGGLAAYVLAMIWLLLWVERLLKVHVQTWQCPPLRWAQVLRIFLAVPITQAVYFLGLITACLARRIAWRGVAYEFDGRWSVKMIEYHPWSPARASCERESVT